MLDQEFSTAQAAVLDGYRVDYEERWIDAPVVDGQAHVLVCGDGPPVVLLNGIGVPAAMWAPLMSRLDGVLQYAVDLPGFGLTDANPRFATDLRANAVRFLIEVLDGLGLDRPTIVANSLGSLWASWLTIDQPDRVAGVAYIGCPAIVFDTSAPLPMRLLSVRPLGRLMMKLQPPSRRQVEQLAKLVHEHPLPPPIANLILATERLGHFEDIFLATLNHLVRLRGNRGEMALTADQLATIKAPALLVLANDDPMGGAPVGRRMADSMNDAELHIVDGGHAPWLHHSDQIAPPLTAFLRRCGTGEPWLEDGDRR
ncbi:MAG: alpha/beta fold hydrolase [Acidimicrobiales bacterium]